MNAKTNDVSECDVFFFSLYHQSISRVIKVNYSFLRCIYDQFTRDLICKDKIKLRESFQSITVIEAELISYK